MTSKLEHALLKLFSKLLWPISQCRAQCELNLDLDYNLINSLPNDTFLDWSKLKAFTGDKIIVIEKLEFVFGRVENVVGNGENAGYQRFLVFPTTFSRGFFFKVV